MSESSATQAPELRALVLAGGRSERLGQDKAALEWGGQSLLERTVRLVEPLVSGLRVAVRADQADDALRRRYALLIDALANAGPAAGLLAAHRSAPAAAWLVVACDLPRLDTTTLEALLRGRDPRRAATAFRDPRTGHAEPLCAIYEPATLARLAAGSDRVHAGPRALLDGADVCVLAPPDAHALESLNTREDLARLRGSASAAAANSEQPG